MAEPEREANEDTREARKHVREAEKNRDALAEGARRVERSTPPEVDGTGPRREG